MISIQNICPAYMSINQNIYPAYMSINQNICPVYMSINQNICPAYMSIYHTKPKLKPTKLTPKSPLSVIHWSGCTIIEKQLKPSHSSCTDHHLYLAILVL